MLQQGIISIASVGGASAESSGIFSINGEDGPDITITGDASINVTTDSDNIILSCSGFVSGVVVQLTDQINSSGQILYQDILKASGIQLINDQEGPNIILGSSDGSVDISLSEINTIDFSCSGFALPREDSDWNGFLDRTNSTIDFDHSTREFSIIPVGSEFYYYIEGIKYISLGDTLTISNTEGIHYIYYNGTELAESVNPSNATVSDIIRTKAFTSVIYWGTNQSSGLYVGEERHGVSMSPVTHNYLHFNEGLRYGTGLGLTDITADGDGGADDHAVFGVSNGSVFDEDNFINISAVPSGQGLPIYYWTGSTPEWNKTIKEGFSVRTFDNTSITRLAFNEFTGGSWQLTEVPDNQFVLCHVFATTELDEPMIAIMGQEKYASLARAQTGATEEIFNLVLEQLLIPEIRPIATVIFQTSDSFSNTVKAAIVSTSDGDDYVDWRDEVISRLAISTSDHNALSNLQGGSTGQYFHLTQQEYSGLTTKYIAYFNNISSGDFNHNLNTEFFNYSIFASGVKIEPMIPDRVIPTDLNNATILFNNPTTGFLTLTG